MCQWMWCDSLIIHDLGSVNDVQFFWSWTPQLMDQMFFKEESMLEWCPVHVGWKSSELQDDAGEICCTVVVNSQEM